MKILFTPLFLALLATPDIARVKYLEQPVASTSSESKLDYISTTGEKNSTLEAIVIDIQAAPVELLFFEVKAQKEYNSLRWVVSSQENIDGFNVLESDDNVKFSNLTSVEVNLSNGFITEYTVIDRQLSSEFSFYKIEFKRKDGKSSFSQVISVENLAQHLTVY